MPMPLVVFTRAAAEVVSELFVVLYHPYALRASRDNTRVAYPQQRQILTRRCTAALPLLPAPPPRR